MNRRAIIFAGASAFLAGCTGDWHVEYENQLSAEATKTWKLNRVRIEIPAELTVSEANSFAPNADIVWHGEPLGDRREQVGAILRDGLRKGASSLNGSRAVDIHATLDHFHAVTPAAVAQAPAAVHNIGYIVQVFDAKTGEALTPPEATEADLEAYVGSAAFTAAINGQPQRVRIVDHIASVTSSWLGTGPDARRSFASVGR